MRNLFAIVFVLISFVVSGCYLSHERPVPVIPMEDSGPVFGDAGPMPVVDSGSDAGDSGSDMSDAGADAGTDAGSDAGVWIPCDPDVGPGGLLVLEDDRAFFPGRGEIVALPGLRHLMDQRILCNPADEDVLIYSFPVGHGQPLGRFYRNVTVEQDGRLLGRFETLEDGTTLLVLDEPIRVPTHSRATFSVWSEIVGLESWAAHPSPDGALHSGDFVSIIWEWGGGTAFPPPEFGIYAGDARGERSGTSYELRSDQPYIYGALYQVVRASWIEIEAPSVYEIVTDANDSDIEAAYFNAHAIGGRAGLKRLGFAVVVGGVIAFRDMWVEIDGRRLTPTEARLDRVIPDASGGSYWEYYLVTLRDEFVFEAEPGSRSASSRFSLHVSVEGFGHGEVIDGTLISSNYGGTYPVTGYLTEDGAIYTTEEEGRVVPGPGIEYSYGPRVGEMVGATWIWSDHSEPDHVDEIRGVAGARDWIDARNLNTAYVSQSHVR